MALLQLCHRQGCSGFGVFALGLDLPRGNRRARSKPLASILHKPTKPNRLGVNHRPQYKLLCLPYLFCLFAPAFQCFPAFAVPMSPLRLRLFSFPCSQDNVLRRWPVARILSCLSAVVTIKWFFWNRHVNTFCGQHFNQLFLSHVAIAHIYSIFLHFKPKQQAINICCTIKLHLKTKQLQDVALVQISILLDPSCVARKALSIHLHNLI